MNIVNYRASDVVTFYNRYYSVRFPKEQWGCYSAPAWFELSATQADGLTWRLCVVMPGGAIISTGETAWRRNHWMPPPPTVADVYGRIEVDFSALRVFRVKNSGQFEWLVAAMPEDAKCTVYRALRPMSDNWRWPWRIRWTFGQMYCDGGVGIEAACPVDLSGMALLLWRRADGVRRSFPFCVSAISRGGGFETYATLSFGGEYDGRSVESGGNRAVTLSARGLDPATVQELGALSEASPNGVFVTFYEPSHGPTLRAAVTSLSWSCDGDAVDVGVEIRGVARGVGGESVADAFYPGPALKEPEPEPEPEKPDANTFEAKGARYITMPDGQRRPLSVSLEFGGHLYYFYIEEFLYHLGLDQTKDDGRTINSYFFFSVDQSPPALRVGALGATTSVEEFESLFFDLFENPKTVIVSCTTMGDKPGLLSNTEMLAINPSNLTVYLRETSVKFITLLLEITPTASFNNRGVSAYARYALQHHATGAFWDAWASSIAASLRMETETSADVFPADGKINIS